MSNIVWLCLIMFDSSTPSRKGWILCAYSIGFDASSGTWLFVESWFFENLDNPCPLAGSWESVWLLMHGLLQIDCWCALPVTWDRNSQKRLEETYPAGCEWSNSHYWEVWTKHTILIAIYHNLSMWCGYPKRFVMFFFSLPPSVLFGEGVFAFGRGAFNVMAVLPSSLRLLQCSSKATKVWQSSLGMTWGVDISSWFELLWLYGIIQFNSSIL